MFDWDPAKAAANLSKHGVSFEEAASVFGDPDGLEGPDLGHSSRESRFLRIGKSDRGKILIVAFTVRGRGHAETIRLISARQASRKERAAYRKSAED